jgi:hypothetical protein
MREPPPANNGVSGRRQPTPQKSCVRAIVCSTDVEGIVPDTSHLGCIGPSGHSNDVTYVLRACLPMASSGLVRDLDRKRIRGANGPKGPSLVLAWTAGPGAAQKTPTAHIQSYSMVHGSPRLSSDRTGTQAENKPDAMCRSTVASL